METSSGSELSLCVQAPPIFDQITLGGSHWGQTPEQGNFRNLNLFSFQRWCHHLRGGCRPAPSADGEAGAAAAWLTQSSHHSLQTWGQGLGFTPASLTWVGTRHHQPVLVSTVKSTRFCPQLYCMVVLFKARMIFPPDTFLLFTLIKEKISSEADSICTKKYLPPTKFRKIWIRSVTYIIVPCWPPGVFLSMELLHLLGLLVVFGLFSTGQWLPLWKAISASYC